MVSLKIPKAYRNDFLPQHVCAYLSLRPLLAFAPGGHETGRFDVARLHKNHNLLQ